jgi:hypothetical protein
VLKGKNRGNRERKTKWRKRKKDEKLKHGSEGKY